MRLSIIISVYNCVDLTRRCLDTLLPTIPQDLDHEIVLIDDGSTDDSRNYLSEFAKQYAHCNVLLNPENQGYARSNNHGARLANGDLLLFLNNDTELTEGWLEPMLAGIKKCAKVGMIGNVQKRISDKMIDHAGVFISAEGKPAHLQVDPSVEYPKSKYSEQFAVTGACFLIAASLFNKVGGFGTEFLNGGEDMDLNFKVKQLGFRMYVANRSVIYHHVSASPGRNDHHEQNTRILFGKWRDLLLAEGALQWCRDYVERVDGDSNLERDITYRKCRKVAKNPRRKPTQQAIDEVNAFMVGQEQAWEAMFDTPKSN